MSQSLRVLIPEDSEDDTRLLVRELSKLGYRPEHRRVDNRAGMQAALEEERWDLILCDYSMPQFTALDALRLVQELKLDIPFIIISGNVGEDVAVQAMKAGAHDYLMKGQLSRLGEAIEREIEQVRIRAEHQRGLAQIRHLNRILLAVRGINHLIVMEKDPESLLQRAADLLVETRGYQNAAFIVTNDDGTAIPFVAVLEDGKREKVSLKPMPLSGLPACLRTAAEAKHPVVVEEDKPDCASCQFRNLHFGRTRLAGPLVHNDKTYGIAVISLPQGLSIQKVEQELFEEMVSDVAFALHGIRLTEQERRSQERFQRLYENMAQGVIYQDATGQITRCNKAAERILGLSLSQMQGRTSMDPRWKAVREDGSAFPGEEHPAMLALGNGEPAQGVMGVHNPAQSQHRWISINAVPEFDTRGGSPSGVFTTFEDITRIRNAEAQLREAQIIAGLGRWELNLRDNSLQWSESIYELFEVDPASFEATYEAFLGFVHPDDREALDVAYRESVESGDPYNLTHRLLMPDGRIKWVKEMGRTSYSDDGTPVRSVGTVQEVTDLKIAEQELKQRNLFIQTILDNLPIGIAVNYIDEGTATYMNRRFSEIYGWPSEDLRDIDRFFELVYPDPEYRQQIKDMVEQDLESGDPSRMRWEGVRATGKDGIVRIIEAANFPLYEQNLMISTVFDISALKEAERNRKMLEAQLNQAQKMESVGRLAGGVAHDYNNMLSVIIGFTEIALEKAAADDSLQEDLKEVLNAAHRSTDITRQLLAFARQQTIAPKVLELNETVEEMLKMLRRLIGEDIDLSWQPGPGKMQVHMDSSQIDQILANLCVNARDAIGGVGKVTIETDRVRFDAEYCADHAGFHPGDFILLAVSDDGCGMDKDALEKVFDPFFTTKGVGEGTGLGLSTVYGIVKQNDGFINVYSEPGKGTTFKIYLPPYAGEDLKVKDKVMTKLPSGHGETVLAVEDETSILKLAKRLLAGLGYNVLTATTPGEALTLAEEHADEIHLLLTDVVMPEMNGRDLSEQMQALYPNLKTLFMSGYTANVIAHRGVLEDGVSFISKPFSKNELAFKIRQVLDNAKTETHD